MGGKGDTNFDVRLGKLRIVYHYSTKSVKYQNRSTELHQTEKNDEIPNYLFNYTKSYIFALFQGPPFLLLTSLSVNISRGGLSDLRS